MPTMLRLRCIVNRLAPSLAALTLVIGGLLSACGKPSSQKPVPTSSTSASEATGGALPPLPPPPPLPPSNRKPGEAPPDVAFPPPHAQDTPDGVSYIFLGGHVAKGGAPKPTDTVRANIFGWTTEGDVISLAGMANPMTLNLSDVVIQGLKSAILVMNVGQKTRIWIPQELTGNHRKRPYGVWVFEIELLDAVNAPPAPADVARVPKNAKVTSSGLAYRVLRAGDGATYPDPQDKVRLHHAAWTTDGAHVGGTVAKWNSEEFAVNGVSAQWDDAPIAGWTEGLQLMSKGEKTRFWIPDTLYPERHDKAKMVVYDLELVEVIDRPAPPPAPKHVAKAPMHASRTKSKLRYLFLEHGDGKVFPDEYSQVRLQYTVWTPDGKLMSSTVPNAPVTESIRSYNHGMREGLRLMRVGDKARFWIPKELDEEERSGVLEALVVDIELLGLDEDDEDDDDDD